MKIMAILVFLTINFSGIHIVKAQDLPFRKEVNFIDSVLRKNPYMENFLGITYYYSIDLTAEKEIIVIMDFNGPFTTTYKASIADLNNAFVVDTSEYSSSMCWHCTEDGSGIEKRCIKQVNLYTTGEKEIVDSDDICIMLPAHSEVRLVLIKAIEELVKKARE